MQNGSGGPPPLFPLWVKGAGGAMLAGSFFFLFRSYTDNTILSPLVRVQKDRGHQVASTGVYGVVRHPMYLGAILMLIGAPLLLGSGYGVLIGITFALLLAARITGEEALLSRVKATATTCSGCGTGSSRISGRQGFGDAGMTRGRHAGMKEEGWAR